MGSCSADVPTAAHPARWDLRGCFGLTHCPSVRRCPASVHHCVERSSYAVTCADQDCRGPNLRPTRPRWAQTLTASQRVASSPLNKCAVLPGGRTRAFASFPKHTRTVSGQLRRDPRQHLSPCPFLEAGAFSYVTQSLELANQRVQNFQLNAHTLPLLFHLCGTHAFPTLDPTGCPKVPNPHTPTCTYRLSNLPLTPAPHPPTWPRAPT